MAQLKLRPFKSALRPTFSAASEAVLHPGPHRFRDCQSDRRNPCESAAQVCAVPKGRRGDLRSGWHIKNGKRAFAS